MTGLERLRHLFVVLQGVEERVTRKEIEFDMGFYGSVPNTGDSPKPICGTSACALGYACMDSVFQEEGLFPSIKSHNRDWYYLNPAFRSSELSGRPLFLAAAKFFSISFEETRYLFKADQPDPHSIKDAIKRVVTVVKKYEKAQKAEKKQSKQKKDNMQ